MWYREKYIKKKEKLVIVMATVTADYPGREEPHGSHECAGPNLLSMATGKWQGTGWQGTAWQEPHEEQGHTVPQPHCPGQALQLGCPEVPHNRHLQINQRKQ